MSARNASGRIASAAFFWAGVTRVGAFAAAGGGSGGGQDETEQHEILLGEGEGQPAVGLAFECYITSRRLNGGRNEEAVGRSNGTSNGAGSRGTFRMGSDFGRPDEQPVRTVAVGVFRAWAARP